MPKPKTIPVPPGKQGAIESSLAQPDVYSQDPTTRLRSLEQTEPIKDATSQTMMTLKTMFPDPVTTALLTGNAQYQNAMKLKQLLATGGTPGQALQGSLGLVTPGITMMNVIKSLLGKR